MILFVILQTWMAVASGEPNSCRNWYQRFDPKAVAISTAKFFHPVRNYQKVKLTGRKYIRDVQKDRLNAILRQRANPEAERVYIDSLLGSPLLESVTQLVSTARNHSGLGPLRREPNATLRFGDMLFSWGAFAGFVHGLTAEKFKQEAEASDDLNDAFLVLADNQNKIDKRLLYIFDNFSALRDESKKSKHRIQQFKQEGIWPELTRLHSLGIIVSDKQLYAAKQAYRKWLDIDRKIRSEAEFIAILNADKDLVSLSPTAKLLLFAGTLPPTPIINNKSAFEQILHLISDGSKTSTATVTLLSDLANMPTARGALSQSILVKLIENENIESNRSTLLDRTNVLGSIKNFPEEKEYLKHRYAYQPIEPFLVQRADGSRSFIDSEATAIKAVLDNPEYSILRENWLAGNLNDIELIERIPLVTKDINSFNQALLPSSVAEIKSSHHDKLNAMVMLSFENYCQLTKKTPVFDLSFSQNVVQQTLAADLYACQSKVREATEQDAGISLDCAEELVENHFNLSSAEACKVSAIQETKCLQVILTKKNNYLACGYLFANSLGEFKVVNTTLGHKEYSQKLISLINQFQQISEVFCTTDEGLQAIVQLSNRAPGQFACN